VRRLFIVHVRADIPDVRIGKANNLARIAWVSKNFLITREAGIKNDFAAAARDGARGSPVKYAPVFQREDCRSVMNFRQWSLRES
jgi:hypothetical protein